MVANNQDLQKAEHILILYGGNYVEELGIVNELDNLLEDKHVIKITDAIANPTTDYINSILKRLENIKVDFVIAIGGGSVIDTCKALCLQYHNDLDLSVALETNKFSENALPFGVFLTNPASGSEGNNSFVIVNSKTKRKIARANAHARAKFAVCDYRYTATLSKYQFFTAISDIFSHLLEQYLSAEKPHMLIDDLIIAAFKNLIHQTTILKNDFNNTLAKENIMLNATLTLSYLLSMGKTMDWNVHEIEHAISGYYKSIHGASLAVIYPKYLQQAKVQAIFKERLEIFGKEIFQVQTSKETVQAISTLFASLELGSNLEQTTNKKLDIDLLVNMIMNGRSEIGRVCLLEEKDVRNILQACLM